MAQKVDKDFVQFVNSKGRKKHKDSNAGEEEVKEESKQSKIFSKKKNQLINYLICDKTAKQNEENEKESIGDWLKENGKKVIVDKFKPMKHQLKVTDDSDNDNEDDDDDNDNDDSESDESEDYEEEKINHFISNKRKRDQENLEDEDSEEAELETLNEMKYLSKKNEGDHMDDYKDDEDEDEELFDDREEEEEEPELEPERVFKPKQLKPKKEFKANLSNTVFISNLPLTLKESDIERHFSKYGDITTIRLIKTKEGESKGFGYVDYESTKGMKTAIGATLQIKGKDIKIEEAKSSYINPGTSSSSVNSKNKPQRLGKKKQKALRNKAKEEKRQSHREKKMNEQVDR